MAKLTQKQELFCVEYAKTGNGANSAVKAGYAPKNARITASKLLTQPNIQHKLQELNKKYVKSSIADIQEMQEKLTDIIRQNASEEIVLAVSKGRYAEVEHDTKKAGLHDVVNAISLLGKMQGAFTDNLKLDISPVVIKDDLDE